MCTIMWSVRGAECSMDTRVIEAKHRDETTRHQVLFAHSHAPQAGCHDPFVTCQRRDSTTTHRTTPPPQSFFPNILVFSLGSLLSLSANRAHTATATRWRPTAPITNSWTPFGMFSKASPRLIVPVGNAEATRSNLRLLETLLTIGGHHDTLSTWFHTYYSKRGCQSPNCTEISRVSAILRFL